MERLKNIVQKLTGIASQAGHSGRLLLNEAVHFEMQAIFIAVPKTGTRSVRQQLKQKGNPIIGNPHLDIMQVRDSLYVYFLKQALGKNNTFPSESVTTDVDVRGRAKDTFDKFFKFSAVRNPWARAVSLYHRRQGVQVSESLSFEEFCKNHCYASDTCRQPTFHKNQFDWMCDENGKSLMDYVYKLENFNDAIDEIAERTNGRVQLVSKKLNNNRRSPSLRYKELYTGETKNMIARAFEKDIDHFKYTF